MPLPVDLSKERVREQMTKILSSTILQNVPVQRDLLQYIVESELSDDSDDVIAERLTGEGVTEAIFNVTTVDEAAYVRVRVEAGRLRKNLAEYYLMEAPSNTIRISIPRGGYRAQFLEKKKGQHLPTTFGPYTLDPATADDIKWAAGYAREVYEGDDVMPAAVMLDWHAANPNGFFVIKADGEPIGNLDILPLRPETLSQFENGKLLERHIAGTDLYTPSETDQITDLYVESLVCNNSIAVAIVLSHFESLVRRICNPGTVKRILAIAASPDGQNLLKRLGFKITGSAQGHNLFTAAYSDVSKNLEAVSRTLRREFEERDDRRDRLENPDKPKGL